MKTATPADIAQKQLNAQKAHKMEIERQIKLAVFGATNYDFVDHLVDNVTLPVKRFVNADSAIIPNGPNGETFTASSHTHFTYATPMVVANLTAMITNVIEHGHGGKIILAINIAQEAAVRLMAGFQPLYDVRVRQAYDVAVPNQALDMSRIDNREIGILGAAEVWVKSWVPANYQFCYDAADSRKPLFFRQRSAFRSRVCKWLALSKCSRLFRPSTSRSLVLVSLLARTAL